MIAKVVCHRVVRACHHPGLRRAIGIEVSLWYSVFCSHGAKRLVYGNYHAYESLTVRHTPVTPHIQNGAIRHHAVRFQLLYEFIHRRSVHLHEVCHLFKASCTGLLLKCTLSLSGVHL